MFEFGSGVGKVHCITKTKMSRHTERPKHNKTMFERSQTRVGYVHFLTGIGT